MKKPYFIFALAALFAASLVLPREAAAAVPTLSLSYTGAGDAVLVTVSGDANSGIFLNYLSTGGSVLMTSIGTTNSSGYFSSPINTGAYNISPNSIVNVTVANQRSESVVWPYGSSSSAAASTTNISLSQSAITLAPNQAGTVAVNNAGTGSLYISGNSSPSVANISISGSQINISPLTSGSTNVSICSLASSGNCATLAITVQSNSSLLFSQTSPAIIVGQTTNISIAGGSGAYTVTSNSNPGVIQATISGSSVNLYALSSAGTASITICSSNASACGIITASAAAVSASSALSFSQTSPSFAVGQTATITISGGSGSYFVSSNSSVSAVQASIVGFTLTLYGAQTGTATISVCSMGNTSQCGVIVATVTATGGTLTLSQASATIAVGQSITITISGGATPYSVLSTTGSAITAAVSGSTLTVTGAAVGNSGVSVCSNGGSCAFFSTAVIASSGAIAPVLSPSSVSVGMGQNASVAITGSGTYYVSANAYPSVATYNVSGSILTVSALSSGATTLTVCQSASQCVPLYVSVSAAAAASTLTVSHVLMTGQSTTLSISGGSGVYTLSGGNPGVFTSTLQGAGLLVLRGVATGLGSVNVCSASQCTEVRVLIIDGTPALSSGPNSGKYLFLNPLSLGDSGKDVTELQKRLTEEGYYAGPVNGSFGPLTQAAVKKYQTAHGLAPLGNVGPGTRAALNK